MPVGIAGIAGRRDVDVGYPVHPAAVTEPEVEIAIRPEGEPAAIVLAVDPVELEEDALRGGIGTVRIRG